MFRHYFIIGWRTLFRSKGYSLINIGGLALGMSVAMLIGLWIFDELTYNHYHKNHDTIAQIRIKSTDPVTRQSNSSDALAIPLVNILKTNYGHHFEHILLATWGSDNFLSAGDKKMTCRSQVIEPGVIDMFSIKMLQGSNSSLNNPHSVILSKSTAIAFFGDDDPMGKSMKIDNRMDVMVSGVYEDLPSNTRFAPVQFFIPWELWTSSNQWVKNAETELDNSSFIAFVQLKSDASIEAVKADLKDFFLKNAPSDRMSDVKKYGVEFMLYPMNQWHLYSQFKDGVPATGRITFVWLFGIIGAFVLLLACINFMNLSTARSEKRAREVGVRKAIGSLRSMLIQQFISESFIVVILAFGIALLLAALSLPLFNELAAKKLLLPLDHTVFWLICLGFVGVTGLMASMYPAFYLSSFQPVKVLKGTFRAGRFAALPRKVLVVTQFSVSITLIIGTLIVYQQVNYARQRPVGYNRQGLINIPMNDPNYKGKLEVLRNELLNTGVVEEMVTCSSPLTSVWSNIGGFKWKNKDPELSSDFSVTYVSGEFGKTVGWEFLDGRDFLQSMKTDSASVVINETTAQYLGMDNPIGETITLNDGQQSWQIIGVIKDMIMTSPYDPEKRALFFLDQSSREASQIQVKIKPSESAAVAIPKIERVFRDVIPSAFFDYKFIDEQYGRKFSQELRVGKLAAVFASLAILISCLGLLGLASFMAEQRTKEIGVRKVMGASVFNLWKMMAKDFVWLVLVAVLIAVPVAAYFMNQWLLGFNYHTEMTWWIFASAGIGALVITLLTVSYQAVSAAMRNPVRSLRSE